MTESLYSQKIEGGLFVDMFQSKQGTKYIQITKSFKKDGAWEKQRIPVFESQISQLVNALLEAQEAMV